MRRRVLILGLFLLLGVTTTVGVAWWSAATIDPSDGYGLDDEGHRAGGRLDAGPAYPYFSWLVLEHVSLSATRVESRWDDPDIRWNLMGGWPDDPPDPLVLEWAPFLVPPHIPTSNQEHARILDARGWPMLSMWSLASYDGPMRNNKTYAITHGIAMPPRMHPTGIAYWPAAYALPLGIRWPGFIVNTLFYAAAWMIMVYGVTLPFRVRCWLRLRRHQCPTCGYPIGVSAVCTECGEALPSAAGESPQRR